MTIREIYETVTTRKVIYIWRQASATEDMHKIVKPYIEIFRHKMI